MAALPNGYHHSNSAANKAVIGLGNGLRASYGKDFDQDSMLYDESKWPEYRIKDSDYSQFPTFAEPVYNGNPNQGDFYDSQMGGSPFDQGVMPGDPNDFSNGPRPNKVQNPANEDLGADAPAPAMGHIQTEGKTTGPKKVGLNKLFSHGKSNAKTPSVSEGGSVNVNANGIKVGNKHPGNSTDPVAIENDNNLSAEQGTDSSEQIGNSQLQQKPAGELEELNTKTKVNTSQEIGNKSAPHAIEGLQTNIISTGAPVNNVVLTTSGNISSTTGNKVKGGMIQAGQKGSKSKGSVTVATHDVKQEASVVKQGAGEVTQSGNDVTMVGTNVKQKGNGSVGPAKQSQGAINIKEAIKEAVNAQVQSTADQGIKEAQDQLVAPNQVPAKASLQQASPVTSQ